MKSITLFALAAAAVLQTATAAKCGSQDCGKDSPCCVRGYCNANAMYCIPFNCEVQNSYSADSCWDTAHCVKSNVNFGSANAFAQIADYKGDPSKTAFVSQFEPSNAKVVGGELQMELVKQGDGKGFGATVTNTRAIQYGTVTAVMRSGSVSGGVVSSFIIRNDKLGDEIDFEFVGADKSTVESNYYWHDQLDYTKMVKSQVLSDTTKNDHTYQIQWTPDQIVWVVDGNAFRTVKRSETWDAGSGTFKYPDSEAYVSFSIWDGGSGAQGTADWAGGAIQWGQGPFVAGVKSVDIDCYYKGNETTYTPPGSSGGDDDDDKSSSDDDEDDESSTDKSSKDDDKSSKDDDKSSSDDDESSEDDDESSNDKTSKDSDKSSKHSSNDDESDSKDASSDQSSEDSSDEPESDDSVDEETGSSEDLDESSDTSSSTMLTASLSAVVAAMAAACAF
ncbi:putative glycosidase CRH2 [Coemansia sp. RSA 2523]|nr:putative glycosidase CRH2 [Coemansia sp. RSA 1752]KAJ1778805.1 putative glycosidase CRH2 [Coemansia sp. RSA 1824]KAJ1793137.1 putative glycosidase CRH2 [Coemansia sp. RSA 2167]KAJ1809057.1 putative glycosidase CRH2 [Coemansia sp. RSA 2523]KAJ2575546.1 putative glycosidase CRH2 [Coemansia sp. RSA 1807]